MRDFFIYVGAYKEESEGQIKELKEAVERFRLPHFCTRDEREKMDLTDLVFSKNEAKIGDPGKLVFLQKDKNPDLIFALRLLLSFGAKGVVLTFGNNENRDYIRENKAYSAKEVKSFAEEAIRLAPLFGRKLA